MLKIFISYHHLREQKAKDELSELILQCYGEYFEVKDVSVKLGDIDPQLPPKKIFKTIREEYLKDSDITVVILGKHTKCRKHIDWEIASSLLIYGSLHRRGKNGLLILLTDDFIKKAKKNCDFNDNDYKTLINEQNSTPRIYENVINNYAIVESFSNVVSNPLKFKKLLDKCQDKVKTEKLKKNFDLFKEINLFEENIEDCPKKSKKKLNCYLSSQKQKSQKNLFEENIEDYPKKSKKKLNCYLSSQKQKSQKNLFEENIEDYPKKSKKKLNCYLSSQKQKSQKNLFEENIEDYPKKSKKKLNCYLSSQKQKSQKNLFEENIEDCQKKSKKKLNCYLSSQKQKSQKKLFEDIKTKVNNIDSISATIQYLFVDFFF